MLNTGGPNIQTTKARVMKLYHTAIGFSTNIFSPPEERIEEDHQDFQESLGFLDQPKARESLVKLLKPLLCNPNAAPLDPLFALLETLMITKVKALEGPYDYDFGEDLKEELKERFQKYNEKLHSILRKVLKKCEAQTRAQALFYLKTFSKLTHGHKYFAKSIFTKLGFSNKAK